MTPFGHILRHAVERTPGAVGGAFAAGDGETVDGWSQMARAEWALFTAHYGVVLGHVQSALHTFHYGDPELLLLSHDKLDILIQPVESGYFAVLAVTHPGAIGAAMTALARAVRELRREMT